MSVVRTCATIRGPQPLLDELAARMRAGTRSHRGEPTVVVNGTTLDLVQMGRRFDAGRLVGDAPGTLTVNAVHCSGSEESDDPWKTLSEEYAGLTFEVGWEVPNIEWLFGRVTYRGGIVTANIDYHGYFAAYYPVRGPIHHYTLSGVGRRHEAKLRKAGLVVDTREHYGPVLVVRDIDACTNLTSGFAGSRVAGPAWTLDEDAYVGSIDTRANWYARNPSRTRLTQAQAAARVAELIEVVRRPIDLSASEVSVLADRCTSGLESGFGGVEQGLIATALEASDCGFRPTPRMIRHLLPDAVPDRREELLAALAAPPWAGVTGRWPKWDHEAEDRRREEAASRTDPAVLTARRV